MMKNKLFIFINIFGLAIAVACCVVAYFNYDYNQSFDLVHKKASSIYRVSSIREFQGQSTRFGFAPIALGNAIKQNVPEVDAVIRYIPGWVSNFRVKDEMFAADLIFVDPSFFENFTFDFVEGDGKMKDKNQIFISKEFAEKNFANERALGKPLTQMLDSGKTKEYIVAGVYANPPPNSSFTSDAYAHIDNSFELNPEAGENSWRYRSTLFVQINEASRILQIKQQLKPYAENNNKVREDFIIKEFDLEPFEGMAVRDSYNEINGTWTNSGSPIAAVVGIGFMGIFVLLIACFNLTNTAIAISSRRLKEIGIRKVMGSSRRHLIFQFIGETMVICFIGLVLGIVIGELVLIPAFNALWPDLKIIPDYFGRPNFLIFTGLTLLFTGLLAGSYPAFYISSFQPTSILKGKLKFGGTNYFTKTLLTLQFAISLIGIVCSLAFTENSRYQRDFDLGFNKKQVVFTYVNNRSEFEIFSNRLQQNPDVTAIASSLHHFYSNTFSDPIKHEDKEIEVDIMNIGDDYLSTMGLTLKEGRDFIKDSETDRKESVIITENLASKFGWDKSLGKEIKWLDTSRYVVVGVVENIYNRGLWREMEPVMFRYAKPNEVGHIIVNAPVDKIKSVKASMENIYKELFPERVANIRYMDEEMVEANTVNNNIVKMFLFLGIVALLLSATGLFTLVSLNIIKKMKEIGVRKVLGASSANITKVINTEFVIILTIASIIGAFAGSWMSEMLMDSIWDYYQKATLTTLIISAIIMFVASALSIGYKVYNTIKLNPSHVLRDE